MRKFRVLVVVLGVSLFLRSCDCDDCGPGLSESILIENKSSNDATFVFFNSALNGNGTSIEINTGPLAEIFNFQSYPSGSTRPLSFEPQNHDSVQVLLHGLRDTTFLPNECADIKKSFM